jgi:hypothetical protein
MVMGFGIVIPPKKFEILRVYRNGDFLIVWVHYPNCTNFNGRKILIYRGLTESELYQLKTLDPHFQEEGVSPIARFKPTPEGMRLAIEMTDPWRR